MSQVIVIDVREEHELLANRVLPNSPNVDVYAIPSRHIFANQEWIAKQTVPVWLLCASGRRSQNIKDTYFPHNHNIQSSVGGLPNILLAKQTDGAIDPSLVKVVKGRGGIGLTQYMQSMFLVIIAILLLAVFFFKSKLPIYFIGLAIIVVILYQLVAGKCWMSRVIPLSHL